MTTPLRIPLAGGQFAECENWSADSTPSEAWGTVLECEFYFYARFNHWSFAVSPDRAVDPFMLTEIEDTLPAARLEMFGEAAVRAHAQGFVRTCYPYGDDEFAASYMPLDEMVSIMTRCLEEYVTTRSAHT